MTTAAKKDLLVGRSIVLELIQTFRDNETKLGTRDAKVRMYLGATSALAGIMTATLGPASAVVVLQAAIKAVERMPDEPR